MKLFFLAVILVFCTCNICVGQGRDVVKKNHTKLANEEYDGPPYFWVFASFIGGDVAQNQYFSKKLYYPRKAKKAHIQGTVIVSFIIEADGSITTVELIKGIGGGCDEEALKLLKNMPGWNPAEIKHKPVKDSQTMLINFPFDKPIKVIYNYGPKSL